MKFMGQHCGQWGHQLTAQNPQARRRRKLCANVITRKLQSERKYAAFGKYIVREMKMAEFFFYESLFICKLYKYIQQLV
jgi:hypothetical protein